MKAVSVDLSENIHCLEIHPFADLHIGDRNCNLKLIKERIELVKNNPNAFIVLNGDIINNATKSSVSDTYGEEMPLWVMIPDEDSYAKVIATIDEYLKVDGK